MRALSPRDRTQLRAACAQAVTGGLGRLLEIVERGPSEGWIAYFVEQGIHVLLYEACSKIATETMNPALLAELQRQSHRETARSLAQEAEIRALDAALIEAGIRCLALKGTPLAYKLYAYPALRPRVDIDLLFHDTEIAKARHVLMNLGYRCPPLVTPLWKSVYLTTQISCVRRSSGPRPQLVDAHWRSNNSLLFADVFSFDELYGTADRGRMPTQSITAPSDPHCLWIACCHRFLDPDRDRLIWIYDIHLLAQRLHADDMHDLVKTAIELRLASVLSDGLRAARHTFATCIDPDVLHRLSLAGHGHKEPAERLRNASTAWGRRFAEMRALPSWRRRLQLLYTALFPPRSYLQLQGNSSERAPLPWLYLKRLCKRRPRPSRSTRRD